MTQKSLREIVTPEGAALHVQLAERGSRAVALVLDLFFMFCAIGALILVLVLFASVVGWEIQGLAYIVFLLAFFAIRSFYFIFFELRSNGRTPGKRIVGLRVINRHGGPLSPAAIVSRNVLREVEVFLPMTFLFARPSSQSEAWVTMALLIWSGIFVFMPLFNRDRLRLGDMVGGTWVIDTPQTILAPDMAQSGGAKFTFTPQQLSAYGIHELQILESVLRKGDNLTLNDVATRIANKIEWEGAVDNPRVFLQDYYAGLRHVLEGKLLFGVRRRDKFDKA